MLCSDVLPAIRREAKEELATLTIKTILEFFEKFFDGLEERCKHMTVIQRALI
jgi:hypothetical protein